MSLEKMFETNGKLIKCKICNSNLGDDKSAPQKSQVEQHIKTSKHQHNFQLKKPKQGMIKFASNEENTVRFGRWGDVYN